MIKLNKNGDTIVEVLLSLSVLSLVLGASYSISSRSLIRAQQAQERVQATKLAEGQIDRLKYLAEKEPADEFNTLIAANGLGVEGKCLLEYDSEIHTIPVRPNQEIEGVNPCEDSDLFTYRLSGYSEGTFTVTVTWLSLKSTTEENVTMFYKVQTL